MARTIRDDRLQTREARLRLEPRREPYWRAIQVGRAIGYRKAAAGKAGTWIARFYDPAHETARQHHALGPADDLLDANADATCLTFAAAQEAARVWFAAVARAGGKAAAPVTVGEAVAAYLTDYVARGGKALPETKRAVNAHILPKLGERKVVELTTATIRTWHRALATAPARVRRKAKATKIATRAASDDPDAPRARRSTANRVLTILKAALNFAFREGLVASDDEWRRVQPFAKADAAKVRYLTDAEALRLVSSASDEFRPLVTAALLTGCRYGELTTLRAGDVDAAANILTIRNSKGGSVRHVVLTDEAARFFAGLCEDTRRADPILTRESGDAWGACHQFRPLRAACEAAGIEPAVSFHILRHTHATRLALKGVPMGVIAAQLGHADLKMTSKHYAHLSPGYVSETIRASFGVFGITSLSNTTETAV